MASEVKALAEQTTKATGEISQWIGNIQSATDEPVGAIKDISNTIVRLWVPSDHHLRFFRIRRR